MLDAGLICGVDTGVIGKEAGVVGIDVGVEATGLGVGAAVAVVGASGLIAAGVDIEEVEAVPSPTNPSSVAKGVNLFSTFTRMFSAVSFTAEASCSTSSLTLCKRLRQAPEQVRASIRPLKSRLHEAQVFIFWRAIFFNFCLVNFFVFN